MLFRAATGTTYKLNNKRLAKFFFYWSIAVLVFKILILINIEGLNFNIGGGNFLKIYNIWLGADGESYLKGYQALLDDGLFATDQTLYYWPAGYPLLILFLSIFGKSWVLLTLSLFQSIIFSFGYITQSVRYKIFFLFLVLTF